ncbi:hypothetical protein PNOK_0718800 [Pyrrhoderma noxium]|uniref:Uncharacterized protein n=1 Tax=Pyrrhoderma noxium TaxID=2282107 RepID=A0A286UC73_9AGAM|nr:hypothetical protein PNOK_0718800 [Pyrrhoderma noxium]
MSTSTPASALAIFLNGNDMSSSNPLPSTHARHRERRNSDTSVYSSTYSDSDTLYTRTTKTARSSLSSTTTKRHSNVEFGSFKFKDKGEEEDRDKSARYSLSSSYLLSLTSLPEEQAQGRGAMGILFKSLTFLKVLPQISSARAELGAVMSGSRPGSWYGSGNGGGTETVSSLSKQRKVMDDLLELTRDDLPHHMRRSALKLIDFSFSNLVRDIFTGFAQKQFLLALRELCSDELPYEIRKIGFEEFIYMIEAAASFGRKNFALRHEDCRIILHILRTSVQVSLSFAACAHVYIVCKVYRDSKHDSKSELKSGDFQYSHPISEDELREVCYKLVELTCDDSPTQIRRDALDWLWRLENIRCSDLTTQERGELWKNLFDLRGKDNERRDNEEFEPMSTLTRLWWFSILKSWAPDLIHDDRKKDIGKELFIATRETEPIELRTRGFELIALFSNLPVWKDMYDHGTWRQISDEFIDFCMRDATRVDKNNIMTRTQLLLMESTSSNSSRLLNETGTEEMSKETQLISKKQNRTSIGFIREIQRKQILDVAALAASQTVKRNCGPDSISTVEASMENLAVFTLPGESVLVMKDQQEILYQRIFEFSKLEATRPIAVQAMYVLMTIQEWISKTSFALGPPC